MEYNGPLTPDYGDFMALAVQPPSIDLVHTYRMVSQKYLDLTRQKLELVRLPQAPRNGSKSLDVGVSKQQLEPLIDHWLEGYNWRRQEDFYNDTLPQFRVPINSTRLHFAHKRSRMPAAVPLLFVHGVPESFISVSKMIDMMVDPMSSATPDGRLTAFHVVAPSIPGTGFSDPVPELYNNIQSTCDIFDALMKGLGYAQYIVHGSGWGFNIARAIALIHPESCIAIHTVNPEVPAPRFAISPCVWIKSRIAKLTSGLLRRLGFGYISADDTSAFAGIPAGMSIQQPMSPGMAAGVTPPITPSIASTALERPQTAAYALSDSPSGLLAYIHDAIRPEPQAEAISPDASRSPESLHGTSPLSPASYAHSYAASTPANSTASCSPVATRRSPATSSRSSPKGLSQKYTGSVTNPKNITTPWTPTALVDWTMLYWLPGPEVALRWLVNSTPLMPAYLASYSMVPLAISHFHDASGSGGTGSTPPQWAEGYHRVAMVRRREGRVRFPAWEVPVEVVMDLREFVGLLGLSGGGGGSGPAPAV